MNKNEAETSKDRLERDPSLSFPPFPLPPFFNSYPSPSLPPSLPLSLPPHLFRTTSVSFTPGMYSITRTSRVQSSG